MMIQGSDAGIGLIVAMFRPVASSVTFLAAKAFAAAKKSIV
jgi:hypothetical protein